MEIYAGKFGFFSYDRVEKRTKKVLHIWETQNLYNQNTQLPIYRLFKVILTYEPNY